MERVKKHLNYLFLDTTPGEASETWKRAGKSTDFAKAMNAETETFDYIEDENPTTELNSYRPSISQTQAAYIGDPIYDFVFDLYFRQATGSDAITKCMEVYQQKNSDSTANLAEQCDALITIDTYDRVAGTITYTIEQRGTATKGTATVVDGAPVFTPAAA